MAGQFKLNSVPGSLVVVGGTYEPWLFVLEQAGWQCFQVGDLRKANMLLEDVGPCIGIVDLSHDEFSLNGLANLVSSYKHVRWLAFIRESQLESETICQFIVNFCIDFFTAPIPDAQLLSTIGHQLGMLRLEKKVWPEFGDALEMGLVGESQPVRRLRDQIKRIGPTDVSILISGERGTDKEAVARIIHKVSSRSHKPFFAINCRALSDERFRKEIFGREIEKGITAKPCLLEQADGGTVLFNDILAISAEQQVSLLRFLQEGAIETPDGLKPLNIRILTSNSDDVERALIEAGFSEELYHRINVLRLTVPSLKECVTDIGLLARYHLQEFSKEYHSQAKSFSEEAMKALMSYSWPGNVRELTNQIKRAVLMSDGMMVEEHHLDLPQSHDASRSLKAIREKSEKDALTLVLESHSGQVSNAAKELGVSRATMYRLLNKHNLITEQTI